MTAENKTKKRQQAKKMMQKYNMSYALAYSVANNECSLHEALVQSRKEVDFAIAVEKYQLNTQEQRELRSGDMSLTDILVRKEYKDHINNSDADPILCVGFSGFFWLHGKEKQRAEVLQLSQYDVELQTQESIFTVPKLQMKAFSFEDAQPSLEAQEAADPIVRIEDRFRISNRLLYRFVLEETPLTCTLLGGLAFDGTLIQAGRYECILQTTEHQEVVLMRHALVSMEVKDNGLA